MKKEIKIKLSQEKIDDWGSLIETLVNESPETSFYLTDGGNTIHIYLSREAGFNLELTKDGRWKLE